MKELILSIIYLLLTILTVAQSDKYLNSSTCPFKLGEPVAITNPGEEFDRPTISPDGTKILVTKNGYDGIYLIDVAKDNNVKTITADPRVGFRMSWSEDGKIHYKRDTKTKNGEYFEEYLTYDLETNSKSSNRYFTSKGKREVDLKYDLIKKIVIANDGSNTWNITQEKGGYYKFLISPDKTKVVIHKNDGRMYLYNMDGSGMITCLGHGLCQSWSPDGKYLLYFIDEDDGHTIINSDIYVCTSDATLTWKLTNTRDVVEMWPTWSHEGNKLVYQDLKTGRIFLCNLSDK